MMYKELPSVPPFSIDYTPTRTVNEGNNCIWMPKKLPTTAKSRAGEEIIQKRPETVKEFNEICRKHKVKSKSVFKIMGCWINRDGKLVVPYKKSNKL